METADRKAPRHAVAAIGPLVFALCLWLRSPSLISHPRFWAEEANLYLANIQGKNILAATFFVGKGNLQIFVNIASEIALRVPSKFIAFPTTIISFLFSIFCCAVVGRFMERRGLSIAAIVCFCVMFALSTAGYEVFLNATNIQWVASIAIFFLCFPDDMPASLRNCTPRAVVIFFLGLSGPPACIATIVYVIWYAAKPTLFRLYNLAAIASAAAIQAAVIVSHRGDVTHRAFHASPDAMIVYLMHSLLTDFLPADLLDQVGGFLRTRGVWASGGGQQITIIGMTAILLIVYVSARNIGPRAAIAIFASSLLVSLVNIFGALEDADVMLSGWAGARYLALGNTCTLMLLASTIDAKGRLVRSLSVLLVVAVICNALWTIENAVWVRQYLTGPSAADQVEGCGSERPCVIKAWPGDGFQFELK